MDTSLLDSSHCSLLQAVKEKYNSLKEANNELLQREQELQELQKKISKIQEEAIQEEANISNCDVVDTSLLKKLKSDISEEEKQFKIELECLEQSFENHEFELAELETADVTVNETLITSICNVTTADALKEQLDLLEIDAKSLDDHICKNSNEEKLLAEQLLEINTQTLNIKEDLESLDMKLAEAKLNLEDFEGELAVLKMNNQVIKPSTVVDSVYTDMEKKRNTLQNIMSKLKADYAKLEDYKLQMSDKMGRKIESLPIECQSFYLEKSTKGGQNHDRVVAAFKNSLRLVQSTIDVLKELKQAFNGTKNGNQSSISEYMLENTENNKNIKNTIKLIKCDLLNINDHIADIQRKIVQISSENV